MYLMGSTLEGALLNAVVFLKLLWATLAGAQGCRPQI